MRKITIRILITFIILTTSCSLAKDKTVHIISIGATYDNSPRVHLKAPYYDCSSIAYCFSKIISDSNYDYNIKIINGQYGKLPTKENIIESIKSIKSKAQDLIIFYFSGHASKPINNETFQTALVCEGDPKLYTNSILDKSICICINELYNELSCKCCPKIVILDTCYSGAFVTKLEFDLFKDIDVYYNNIYTIASSHKDEVSYEPNLFNIGPSHGYFTKLLLKNLNYIESDNLTIYKSKNYSIKTYGLIKKIKTVCFNDLVKNFDKGLNKQHPCYTSYRYNFKIN